MSEPGQDGSMRAQLQQATDRFAAWMWAGVALVLVPLALSAAPKDLRPVALAVGGVVLLWSLVRATTLLVPTPRRFVAGDVALVAFVALTQPWTTPPEAIGAGGNGWAMVFSASVLVAWQLYLPMRTAVLAWAATIASLLTAAALSRHGLSTAYGVEMLWLTGQPVIARLFVRTVQRAADCADVATRRAERARADAEIAAARRREERGYAATLHDTAASTLLMVGLGAVERDARWLRRQARRDLQMILDHRDEEVRGPAPAAQSAAPGLAASLEREATVETLQRGVRYGVLAVVAALFVIQVGPRLAFNLDRSPAPALQLAAAAICAAVAVVGFALARRNRSWGQWAGPAAGALLVTTVLSWVSLPSPVDTADWHYGLVVYIALIVLFDRPLRVFVAFLLAHYALSAGLALTVASLDGTRLLVLAMWTVAIIAMQMAVGGASAAMRRIAVVTVAAARREADSVIAERVGQELHAARLARYRELDRSVVPLLVGLAAGSLDPAQDSVQHRAALEAARLRGLFGDATDVPHPLLYEVRTAAEGALRRGVVVTVESTGDPGPMSAQARRALLEPLLPRLLTAEREARVALVAGESGVSLSVVADPPAGAAAGGDRADRGEAAAAPIDVVLIDDHPAVVAAASAWCAAARPPIRVVATGDELAVAWADPDAAGAIIVLDLQLRGQEGVFDDVQRLAAAGRAVIVLSGRGDQDAARRCLRVGALTYLTKAEAAEHLVPAVTAAADVRPYLPPTAAGGLVSDADPQRPVLTARERAALTAWFECASLPLAAARIGEPVDVLLARLAAARLRYAAAADPAPALDALLDRGVAGGLLER